MGKPWIWFKAGDTVIIDIPDKGNSLFYVQGVRPYPGEGPGQQMIDCIMIPPDGSVWTFTENQMIEEARLVSII